jgi:hypothetical protein
MTKQDQIARNILIDYAKRYLRIKARRTEEIRTSLEEIAGFASQVRDGCKQDLIRLIQNLADDDLHATGKEALLSLAGSIDEGESIELWGLPDCNCGKTDCVYCGRGLNVPSGENKMKRSNIC